MVISTECLYNAIPACLTVRGSDYDGREQVKSDDFCR